MHRAACVGGMVAALVFASSSAWAEGTNESAPTRHLAVLPVLRSPLAPSVHTRIVLADAGGGGGGSRVLTTGTGRYAHKFFEIGASVGSGWLTASPGRDGKTKSFLGIHLADNDIFLGRLFFAMMAGAARAETHTHVSSTYEYRADGLYKVDVYRPLTDQEIAERDRVMAEAMMGRYVGELSLYFGGLNGWEYRVGESNPLYKSDMPILFQMGLVLAHASSKDVQFKAGEGHHPPTDGKPWQGDLYYSNIGVWLRLVAPLTRFAEIDLNWDLNIMQIAWNAEMKERGMVWNSPLRLGFQLNLTDWFFMRADLMGNQALSGRVLGGLRF